MFIEEPAGLHHLLHSLSKTAHYLYNTMKQRIRQDGWTEVWDMTELVREMQMHPNSISRAKRELLEAGVIQQKPFRLSNGKAQRGAFTYYLIPTEDAIQRVEDERVVTS